MPKSEIEDHVVEVYKRVYGSLRNQASVRYDADDARGMIAQAAARVTKVIIQTERDER